MVWLICEICFYIWGDNQNSLYIFLTIKIYFNLVPMRIKTCFYNVIQNSKEKKISKLVKYINIFISEWGIITSSEDSDKTWEPLL